MRFLQSLLAIVSITLLGSLPIQAESLRVGYFFLKPHAVPISPTKAVGVDIDYFERIAKKMAISTIVYSELPIHRLLRQLNNNQIDMALLLAKTPDRATDLVYPSRPYMLARSAIAVEASFPVENVHAIDDILPFTIHIHAGAYRSPFLRDPRLKLQPLHHTDFTKRCFSKLLKKRIDICYEPGHYALLAEAANSKYKSKIRLIPLPETPKGYFSVFSKESAKKFLRRYEAALDKVSQEISYEVVYQRYFESQRPHQIEPQGE